MTGPSSNPRGAAMFTEAPEAGRRRAGLSTNATEVE